MFRVNEVTGGDLVANALIYRPPPDNVMNYIQSNLQNVASHITDMTSGFVNTVTNLFNSVHSDQNRIAAKMAIHSAAVHLDQYSVVYVPYEELNRANLRMQNYILVHPEVSTLYEKNMCYGYADTHIPIEVDTYGKNTLSYGQVMDGVVQYDDTGSFIEHYIQDDEHIGEELDPYDQIAVLDTWHNVSKMLANGLDPTDPIMEEL